jgi:uncharacterized protein (TIGR02145 family)
MAENLRFHVQNKSKCGVLYGHESNGYLIDSYQNSECSTYGYLYNWETATTGGLCPEGWHIPNNDDWRELYSHSGTNCHINDYNTGKCQSTDVGENLRNSDGFAAMLGGYGDGAMYKDFGKSGFWWSVHTEYTQFAVIWSVGSDNIASWKIENNSNLYYSVRCIKNN